MCGSRLVNSSATTRSNNGMHPTANSVSVIRKDAAPDALNARRVMPGVRFLPYGEGLERRTGLVAPLEQDGRAG